MQSDEGAHDTADIGSCRRGRDHGSPAQERQQSPHPNAGQDREHGNDEEDVAYAVVESRTLDDEERHRENSGQAHDQDCALARH